MQNLVNRFYFLTYKRKKESKWSDNPLFTCRTIDAENTGKCRSSGVQEDCDPGPTTAHCS